MKSPLPSLRNYLALTTLMIASLAVVPAGAQNPNFAPGDLLMGFQVKSGVGSDQTVLVNLGNTATLFRDASSNVSNLAVIGELLDSVFGLGAGNEVAWYDNPNLYFGLAGVWSASGVGSSLQNGDPSRTLYVSKSRIAGGIEGARNSNPEAVGGNTFMSDAANSMNAMQKEFEEKYTTRAAVIPKDQYTNTWDDYNEFFTTTQKPGFGAFVDGIQQAFAAGSYGSFSMGTVEGALDLYRFQAVSNINGQYGQGSPVREPEFQGTVVIDQSGMISFLVVPEPSSALLLSATALFGGLLRRRPPAPRRR